MIKAMKIVSMFKQGIVPALFKASSLPCAVPPIEQAFAAAAAIAAAAVRTARR